jgi:choline dehydrogenase
MVIRRAAAGVLRWRPAPTSPTTGTALVGPIPVSRLSLAELGEYPRAFHAAAVAAGHPPVADHNRPGALGVGSLPRNVRDGTRMSTALTYLAPARPRPNLEIRPDTLVDRVLLNSSG